VDQVQTMTSGYAVFMSSQVEVNVIIILTGEYFVDFSHVYI